MSGGLVVDGFEQIFPLVQRLPERFFLIKHLTLGVKVVPRAAHLLKPSPNANF